MIRETHFILFVEDQSAGTTFFQAVLGIRPRLDVPGMTEFALPGGGVLGLMPTTGATKLLGQRVGSTAAEPRGELYLLVDDPTAYHGRSIAAGAREVSALAARNWGHEAAYSITVDGYAIAFAREL